MTRIDELFAMVRRGDPEAFAEWMGCVEHPIRRALFAFVQAVDVESIVQETLMRMWILAQDRGRELTGDNASLRFAIGMARNLARSEARRLGREVHLPPENLPEPVAPPDPPHDPGLRQAITDCLDRVAKQPLAALRARLNLGAFAPDSVIAQGLGMKLNTFFKNIERARTQLADCLRRKGVPLEELLS